MSASPHRVLVVDDEPNIADVVAMALRFQGFEVETAGSGDAALAAVAAFRPHIMVLDIMLPDFDGFEVARVRTVLRRTGQAEPESSRLTFEDLELDDDTREVARAGAPVDLTATEYRLLRYLMLNPRRVLTRDQLLNHVWDYDFGGDARVLETYVSYLRKKLDGHGPSLIHTVRGVGYALRAPRS